MDTWKTVDIVWVCRNPGTLNGVLPYILSWVVCTCRTFHRCTSTEDSDVRAGESSPPDGWLVPGHMGVEDSFVWFSQTILALDCFPGCMMYLSLDTNTWKQWTWILGNSGHGYLDTWKWIAR
ncbi:hypothetical protein L3X38_036928 [Prunus dulcis]|uniref:Uncharacterized protein n=1 Tax=Prunus dulcis TaxID=3755 RepID=A0AAD4V481_PRUDU|nr:hypothetical protein L3X38_036928 [Prunus dulcis]